MLLRFEFSRMLINERCFEGPQCLYLQGQTEQAIPEDDCFTIFRNATYCSPLGMAKRPRRCEFSSNAVVVVTSLSREMVSAIFTGVWRVAQSVQRLATGWTDRGSNPGGGESFRTCPERPWGPPSLLCDGYRVFPGSKERLGRDADPSPPSRALVKKEQSYTSTLPMGRTACTEPQCLYKGALYLYLLCVIRNYCF